jgi:ATP-dependent Clp protease ATP-binding subunit ClpA
LLATNFLLNLMGSFYILKGRQFPDKAIDLIDEASAITRIHTDNQLKGNNMQHSPVDALKKAIVCPDQVAQACYLYSYV